MTVRGDYLPAKTEQTSTEYIVREGIAPFSETKEDGTVEEGYSWTETRLTLAEQRLVEKGELPAGASWTTALRRIHLLAELAATDYIAAKLAEATTDEESAALRAEYAQVIADRKAWRAEINSL